MHLKKALKYFLLGTLVVAFMTGETTAANYFTTAATVVSLSGSSPNSFIVGQAGPRKFERLPNGVLVAVFYRILSNSNGTTTLIFSTDNGLTWSDDITIAPNTGFPSDYRNDLCVTYDNNNNVYVLTQNTDADSGAISLRFVKLAWTGSTFNVSVVRNIFGSLDGSSGTSPIYWFKNVLVDKDGTVWVIATITANPSALAGYYPYGLIAWKSTDGGNTFAYDTTFNSGSTQGMLQGSISSTATSVTLTGATIPVSWKHGFSGNDNMWINVGGEWMVYTASSGATLLTVRRGYLSPQTATSNITTLGTDTVIRAGVNTDLSTYRFPSSGIINLDGEKIAYTGLLGNWFTGCTRALTIKNNLALSGSISAAATTVTVNGNLIQNGYEFNQSSLIRIDNEIMSYAAGACSADGTILTVTRNVFPGSGIYNSGGTLIATSSASATTHSSGATIWQGEATLHVPKAVITAPSRFAHAYGDTVWQPPYWNNTGIMSTTLYNGYPVIFYNTLVGYPLVFQYYNGSTWSAPANVLTPPGPGTTPRANGMAYTYSPVTTDNGELNLLAWHNADKTVKQFQWTGSTWISNYVASDVTYMANNNLDAGLTTNGVDLCAFYERMTPSGNFVICSKIGTKTGSTWTWGTETTVVTDVNTNGTASTQYHGMDTITYSGKSGFYPVFWQEASGNGFPYYLKFGKVQTPLFIRSVSPLSASNTSVATLSVSGSGFLDINSSNKVSSVKLSNGVSFSAWTVSDDLTLNSAVLPAGTAPGTYNVIVTDSAGLSATSAMVLTVTGSAYSAPTVTGITPAAGCNVQPSTVAITGTNFMGGVGSAGFTSSVALSASGNTYQLTGWTVANESTINGAVLAVGTPVGTYNVLVTTGAGVSPAGSTMFTVNAGPDVKSITPSSGSEGSAATLTLTGSGFFGGNGSTSVTAINLNDGTFTVALSGYSVISDSVITGAVVPYSAFPSTYNIMITTTGTTNLTSTAKYVISRYSFSGSNAKQVNLPGNSAGPNNVRRLILNSDGKIAAFFPGGDATGGPLCFALSSDGGATFGSIVTIGGGAGTLSNTNVNSIYKDPSSDNIYAVYYNTTIAGAGGRRRISIKKLSYTGASYMSGSEITVVTNTSTSTMTTFTDFAPHNPVLQSS